MTSDPKRLLEDAGAPEALRSDLALAARADGIGFDVEAGLQRFEAAIGSTVEVGGASSGTGSGGLALGIGLGLGGLGAIALTLFFGLGADPSPTGAGSPLVAAPVAAPVPEPELDPEPINAEVVARDSSMENPARAVAQYRHPPAQPDREGGALEQPEKAEPEAARRVVATDGERSSGKRRRRASKTETSASESDERDPSEAVSAERPDDRYLREVRQLHRARGELASDPKRALELAKAGQREFPSGALRQEWEGLVILALNELGEREEAGRRGDAFLAKYPDGPFSAKIRRALGK